MAPLVEVKDLQVEFTTRDGIVKAVNGISFSLEAGRVLTILGESGSGKSVTLRSLVRLLPKVRTQIRGEILLKGMDLYGLPEHEVQDIRGGLVAMIFQEPMTALDPVYTVGEQIVETLVRHQEMSRSQARRRALELLETVQIPSPAQRLKSYPHEMSGGMRQRAMIAIALACNPELLLADEPTTALDVTVQAQILYLLRELQERLGMAVIFVTHDLGVAAEIADEVAVMYAGRIVEYGPVRQVLRAPAHPYTQGLMHATVHRGMKGRDLVPIPGQPPDLTRLPPGCSFAARCPSVFERCQQAFPAIYPLSSVHMARCFLLETAHPSASPDAALHILRAHPRRACWRMRKMMAYPAPLPGIDHDPAARQKRASGCSSPQTSCGIILV